MSSKPISAARRRSTFANESPRASRRKPTRQAAGLYSAGMGLTFSFEVSGRMGITFVRAKGQFTCQLTRARSKVTGEKPGGSKAVAKSKPSIRRLVETRARVDTGQNEASNRKLPASSLGTRQQASFVPRRKSQVRIVGA